MLKKAAVGAIVVGGGAGIAGYFAYSNRLKANAAISAVDFNKKDEARVKAILESPETLKDATPFILYRYTTCPFCFKVQTFLDYHKLNYKIVEVNPLTKKEIVSTGYPKVPQLQLGASGPTLVDSQETVDLLYPVLTKESSQDVDVAGESKWRNWANERLVRYMVINTNRTLEEANKGYQYVEKVAPFSGFDKWLLKLCGGPIMYMVSSQITSRKLKSFGYDGKDPRAALYKEVDHWVQDGLNTKPFHGGQAPDRADLDIYAIIQSQRFMPVVNDLKQNTDPRFANWYERMDSLMPESYRY